MDSTYEPDIAGTPARRWALGLMIVASASALLATSDVKHPVYSFKKSSDGPGAVLSALVPHARYLVRVQVNARGPEQVDTTESALATAHGTITANASANTGTNADAGADAGASGASSFVSVRFGESIQASDTVAALTSFNLARPVHFTGNCTKPDQSPPCQAELELDFDLTQPSALTPDASLIIDWSIDFESRAFRPNGGSDETSEAPWTAEISELSEP